MLVMRMVLPVKNTHKKNWKPKTNLTISTNVKERAQAWAQENGCSLSELVDELLSRHLANPKRLTDIMDDDENDAFMGVILKMHEDGTLPKWIQAEIGSIVFDGKSTPYVKTWSVIDLPKSPTRRTVETLRTMLKNDTSKAT